MKRVEFITAKKIICDVGAVKAIADHCHDLHIRKPMLLTDPGILKAGIAHPAIELLKNAGLEPFVYSDIEADPPEHLVLAAVAAATEQQVDGVIGLGGGSSMDVAKLVAVLVGSEQPLSTMYGIGNVKGSRLPLLLLPTTAGTGSEVTPTSIITTGATTKAGVIAPQLLPDIAILDAELTVGLPAHVTAATGIDAMVHAIEAFTSKHKKNIYSDLLAREALTLMAGNLREAVANPTNLEARSKMLLGAMMAGQAFANAPVAAVHALAYPLGGNYHIPHGLSNSLVLPSVLRFNAQGSSGQSAQRLYAELLPCVMNGYAMPSASASLNAGKDPCAVFIDYMEELIADLKLPTRLRELTVPEHELGMLADEAMLQQRLLVNNPREVTRDDAFAIYKEIF